MRSLMVGLTAFLIFIGVGTAHAQSCASGRVATTEGYCCWPGQSWSDVHQRCDGPPSCPVGMAAEGNGCVANGGPAVAPATPAVEPWPAAATPSFPSPLEAAPVPAPTLDLSSAGAGSAWPSASTAPAGATNPHREPQMDLPLLGVGIGLLGSGYLVSIGEAVSAFDDDGRLWSGGTGSVWNETCHDTGGALLLVPVLGALMGAISFGTCEVPVYENYAGARFQVATITPSKGAEAFFALGVLSTLLQFSGAAMIAYAILFPGEATAYGSPEPATTVSLMPYGTSTSAGLTLRVDWF